MSECRKIEFGSLYLEPSRNGLSKPKSVRGKGTKFINMGEIFQHDRMKSPECDRVSLLEKEKYALLKNNDLLFARQSLVISGAGKCSIFLDDSEKVCFESHIIRVRLDAKRVEPLFYYYFFRSYYGRTLIETIVEQGAGASGIRGGDLQRLIVPFPPLPEQKAIASILGSLDDKIELNRQMNETLEAMARAIFKDWFVDFGPTRAKMDSRPPYLPGQVWSLFPDTIDEETGLPQGWNLQPIANNCSRVVNGGTPKKNNKEYWENGNVPWLTSGEVRQKIIVETQNFITKKGLMESSAKIIDTGSTVVALYGATAGQVSYLATEVSTNQAICSLTPKENYQAYNYLCLSNNTDILANMARGSAQQNLSKGLVESFQVISSSSQIMSVFEQILNPFFEKSIDHVKESQILAELRDRLLPKLMSGEIRVKEAEKMVEEVM